MSGQAGRSASRSAQSPGTDVGALFTRIASETERSSSKAARPSKVLSRRAMRSRIIESLEAQGFTRKRGALIPPEFIDKDEMRKKNLPAVQLALSKAEAGLRRHQDHLLDRFARGVEVDPQKFSPKLVEVGAKTDEELLFRFARLQWSIPTSAGYGRRLRFLVVDEANDKLVGLVGLGDPVFALRPRDAWIGWSRDQCRAGLHNVMDAFVLGAVPPYSYLLGGKLVALLVGSDEVRAAFARKYGRSSSVINQRDLRSRLALVTTTSALGRSSIYNRLRHEGRTVFESVGFTRGSGEFHFSNGLYADIRRFAEANCTPTAKQERWGAGFRSRREVIRKTLIALGLSGDWLYHGLEREVFVVPLAANARSILRGDAKSARWHHTSAGELGDFYRTRWMLPRAERDGRYKTFDPSSLRLWGAPPAIEDDG
ncbi:MAG: hypothetical protein QOF60_171 [Actinomycetota bacterium]|nr:hypothetical protein [Actinomycetota bacterium]